ncbi:MAG: NIPSNAP family protein [Acidimicrobiia bacterium]|nr:NIPSNAP family protein [Acidimicrobiia bacterium]
MASRSGSIAVVMGAAAVAFLAGSHMTRKSVEAQSAQRVFELRTYTTIDGRLQQLVDRHKNGAIPLFEKHGMHVVGFWVAADAPKSSNTLTYILAHPSREAAETGWKRFLADPGRDLFEHEPIVEKVDRVFLHPTDFSRIR